ncbi:MAG: NAD(P)(+) transhydrogenase (Re/Si-specific) subunit alpha [Dehalococcoidales bacterium]|jgi:NAD(P) transhydrogenase subunit alpha|nr:NAD(P)(+) transhydrogenase (Re/Si-specific) subunit alpha [Dehalococcoidales bacterium]MDP6221376.1 Re/Si-specific NAD(P)(+) transhydrogenase subunit alpha [Dehalococcoidales bacterium]MDP7109638.1 Re/Si-specific NAD(P)(+) transhydrogenase subunit alpha [Dehalococcoidales bacterium]MDP7310049.1 Re/Si-specific NAD(P)(+) transhydrogenase subunit alpha [Dehalococcoidales bacterium]MDP7409571.1 Re/Si-specific NAD(P)(+) transhydrogenase subunit alpha [Dehalococcoidales bacterium]
MVVGIPKEIVTGEKRVSVVPGIISRLKGISVVMERGAGEAAGFPDTAYVEQGVSIVDTSALYEQSDIILKIQTPTATEARLFKEGTTLISFLYPLTNLETIQILAARRVNALAMNLIPRSSRAQSMDALSSQAIISGYKAVLLGADSLPRLFPMLMTAAGTIPPAKVFVIGAGVAGLQAIAVARRLGAMVEAYDVRPAAKEEIKSLGATFVELPIESKEEQAAGGYAKIQSEEFYRKQQELLAEHAQVSDIVITTALVPGRRAPILVSEDAVKKMRLGSVIVDLAAEQGGNCILTEPGKSVVKYGITIHGLLNLPSTMAPQASQLYSRNITSFLLTILKDGTLNIDRKDDLIHEPLVIFDGEIVHEPTKAAISEGMPK